MSHHLEALETCDFQYEYYDPVEDPDNEIVQKSSTQVTEKRKMVDFHKWQANLKLRRKL